MTFTDSEARVQFLEVAMTAEQFALAVTNLVVPDVKAEVLELDLVGTISEHKEEFVPHNPNKRAQMDEARTDEEAASLFPFEVDGWIGRTSDLRNFHRNLTVDMVNGYRVTFTRNVPKS